MDKGFNLHFGYTLATDKKNLWMGIDEMEFILKKIELLAPGLTQEDDGSGNLVPTKLCKSFSNRIQNDNTRRRNKLVGQQNGKLKKQFL